MMVMVICSEFTGITCMNTDSGSTTILSYPWNLPEKLVVKEMNFSSLFGWIDCSVLSSSLHIGGQHVFILADVSFSCLSL